MAHFRYCVLILCAVALPANGLDNSRINVFRAKHNDSGHNLFFEAMANIRKEAAELKENEPVVAMRTVSEKQNSRLSISQLNQRAGMDGELFEGDMILNNEQTTEILGEYLKNATSRRKRQTYIGGGYPKNLWPVFYYQVPASLNSRAQQTIAHGIKFWNDNTCVRFVKSATQKNRARFISADGCWSDVGMIGGVQDISIGNGCEYTGITIHEIGHALGFYHTQERFDRDNAITVYLANVQAAQRYNFQKMTKAINQNYGAPYDYGSVMQYDATAFGIGGKITMNAKIARYQDTMGSYIGSFYDIYMINKHYQCKCKTTIACRNGGMQNPKKCLTCICPSGWGGKQCTVRTPGCGAVLQATSAVKNVVVSAGNGNAVDRILFSICNWQIKSPVGTKIEVTIKEVRNTYCEYGCYRGAVEIKALKDHRYTGLRFCCKADIGQKIVSEGNIVPIIVSNSYSATNFLLSYRSVPSSAASSVRLGQFHGAAATF